MRSVLVLCPLLWVGCGSAPVVLGTWDIVSWTSGPVGGASITTADAGFMDFRENDSSTILLRYSLDASGPSFVPVTHPQVGTFAWDAFRLEDDGELQFGVNGGSPWYFTVEEKGGQLTLDDDGTISQWTTTFVLAR